MDEIETRLREMADNCLSAYGIWNKSKRDKAARETMAEAVHELRKVCARLEIELGASEREEMSQRPIPVPPHRSAQRRTHDDSLPGFITGGYDEDEDDNVQPMPQRGQQGGGRHQHNNRGGHQNRDGNQSQNRDGNHAPRRQEQPRSEQPRQEQPQQSAQQNAPQAPAAGPKTVTLERRFGRGRAAADTPKPEAPASEPAAE
ncbi:MAG: hypothetical protein V4621_06630 [Pseudomonadota bacterium]